MAAATPVWAERTCNDWQATFVAVEGGRGAVEFRRDQDSPWEAAVLGTTVCTGYSVRVGDFGDATLQFPDKTALRLQRNSVMTLEDPEDETGIWVALWRGLLHVVSRDPRALRFTTPYANAGLEGTEFEIGVANDHADVAVIEGEVAMTNDTGQVAVRAGERGVADSGGALRTETLADRFEGTDWTPYYARIFYGDLPPPGAKADSGELGDPNYLAARGARWLEIGDIERAGSDIEAALRIAPRNATALALRGLIELRSGNKSAANNVTQAAVEADPRSGPAWIARAYVQQANFESADALASLLKATRIEPKNALAWALLAEVRLSREDPKGARLAAETATRLAPDLARAHTVLGFAELGRSADAALASFKTASALDPADPLPRIGAASALIARGEFDSGRDQSEIAVILDPLNSQTRSYMAKIYAEEDREELSEAQLQIAKWLDPTDPTPYYYESLAKQSQNRPVDALRARRNAIELNESRPIFRSTLRLDEDLPVRSAGLGQMHKDLGFANLALLEGWKATLDDPVDYSGHRLLTDVSSTLPRHEIARVSELYQSELLQPLNVTPIPPQLAEANLFILESAGPSEIGFSEFGPYVRENGLSFLGSAVAAGNDTQGADFVAAGLTDRVSYSVGHFAFKSDGFRANNDIDQSVTNALVQFRPNQAASYLTEMRTSDIEKGDLRMLFDPDAYNRNTRQHEKVSSLRLGMRRDLGANDTLLTSVIVENQRNQLDSGPDFSVESSRRGINVDVQHLHRAGRWQLTSGLHHSANSEAQHQMFSQTLPFPIELFVTERFDVDYTTAYVYSNVRLAPALSATLGLSGDLLRTESSDESQLNPKLGLIYEPTSRTTLRISASQTLEGPLFSRYNVQPRLEPTHVVGFNQFFFGSEGEKSRRFGVAVDHEFSDVLFGGVEVSGRDVELETRVVMPDSTTTQVEARDESLLRSYLYWTPTDSVSIAAEYQFERIEGNGDILVDGIKEVSTHRIPLTVNMFGRSRIHGGIKATWIEQRGQFNALTQIPDPIIEPGQDSFWVVDLSLSYRLPRRRGNVSLNIDNAFDTDFRFQDTDPENPTLMPERLLALRFTLAY